MGPGVSPLPEGPHLRDGLHHGEPHEDGADGVVLAVVRQATDAIVTVTQDLDPQLVVFLKGPGRGWGPESRLGRETWASKQRKARREGSVGVWEGQAQATRVAPPLESWVGVGGLTAASLSKRAKSSLSSFTSSCALQAEDSWVKPTMSANRMLQGGRGRRTLRLQPQARHRCQLLLPAHGSRGRGRRRCLFKPHSSAPPAPPGRIRGSDV